MITQRAGKLTVAQAKALGSDSSPIINFVYRLHKLQEKNAGGAGLPPATTSRFVRLTVNGILAVLEGRPGDPHPFWLISSQVVKGLGEPLVRVREFESSPGLWAFDDAQSKITFLIWSDGYKAKPWKGTSIEAIASSDQLPLLEAALSRLDCHLRLKHAEHRRQAALAAAQGPMDSAARPRAGRAAKP